MLSTAPNDRRDQPVPPDGSAPGGPPGGGGPGGPPGGPPGGAPLATPQKRRGPRWLRVLALIVAIPLYLAVSVIYVRGAGDTSSTATEVVNDHTLPVVGSEMKFDSPLKIEPGWTTIAFRNDGGLAHQASIYKLHDGIDGNDLAQQLRANRDAWNGKADPVGGLGGIPAGKSAQVALELGTGHYLITCFLRGGSAVGESHVQFGMARVLDVQPAAAGADLGSPPASTGEFLLRDDGFTFPAGFNGHGVFKVTNTGTQPHELSILRLGAGKTDKDFLAFMQASALAEQGGPKPTGGPPFTNAGGFTIANPGTTGVMVIDLEPGNYVASDFIPDPTKGGLPHFMGGMLEAFTVN
jgi:hypothetical protein